MYCLLSATAVLFAGLPEPQEAEVLQWARRYRVAIYEAYRNDRPEFDRRRHAGEALLRRWKNGESGLGGHQVVRWFRQAAESAAKFPGSLPPPMPREPGPPIQSGTESPSPRQPAIANPDHWPAPAGRKSAPDLADMAPQFHDPGPPALPPPAPAEPPPPDVRAHQAGPVPRSAPATSIRPPRFEPPSGAAPAAVPIDVTVLTARIESENMAFRAIETKLNESRTLENDELELVIGELEQLLLRQEMSGWYRDTLSRHQQHITPELFDTEPIRRLIGQRIFEAETEAIGQFQKSKLRSDKDSLDKLRQLSKRVQSWQT